MAPIAATVGGGINILGGGLADNKIDCFLQELVLLGMCSDSYLDEL